MKTYQLLYEDEQGVEEATLSNDGRELRTTLRGVRFHGSDFDDLTPDESTSPHDLRAFTLGRHLNLCQCRLRCLIPVTVSCEGSDSPGTLEMSLFLGTPNERGGIDREELALELRVGEVVARTTKVSGDFESALLEVGQQLPPGWVIRCCFTCAYSDYSVYGQGLIGPMMCYRDIAERYLQVTTKREFMNLMEDFTEIVQEIYQCPKYMRRRPGTGYRG